MSGTDPAGTQIDFRPGDNVVILTDGLYPNTLGVFVGLRPDVNWAEIRERSGAVRGHPVVWLQHSGPPGNALP